MHKFSSFCPYCMKSQIEKQSAVIQKKNPKKRLYFLIMGVVLALLIVTVFIFMNDRKELHENNSSIAIESIVSTSATSTDPTLTTVTTTITQPITTEIHTTKTKIITTTAQIEIPTVFTDETTSNETVLQLGDYLTEGKTSSQIQGYGGYENIGGIILTIEEINEATLTFSIVQYSESGYASDTVSARNITAEIIDNKAEFQFSDMLDGKGYGILTFEQGKIRIVTYPDETTSMQTSIIVDEWLS